MAGQSFAKQDLRDAGFRNAKLADADFSGADLRGADFSGADLKRARFCGAVLGRSGLPETVLHLVSFGICGLVTALSIGLNIFCLMGAFSDQFGAIVFLVGWIAALLVTVAKGLTPATLCLITALSAVVLAAVAAQSLFEVAIAAAAAIPIAVAIAGGVAVAGVGAAAGAITAVWMICSVAMIGTGFPFGSGPGKLPLAIGVAVAAQFALTVYIRWRLSLRDPKFAHLAPVRARIVSIGGTSFRGAGLSHANFEDTTIAGACFEDADITRVRWRGVRRSHESGFGESILSNHRVERLLTAGETGGEPCDDLDLHGANLDGVNLARVSLRYANLSGASLRGASLMAANLAHADCAGADFTGACLTGTCLEGWRIDDTTVLEDLECRFVFLREADGESGNRERRPPFPGADFQPGEFIELCRPDR